MRCAVRKYEIVMTGAPVDFRKARLALIDNYVWGCEYRPEAYARLAFVPGDGFYAKLTVKEKDPRAVYRSNMDPVYKDSCLEFFAAYKPGGYINCEMNANGAILSAYGAGREGRVPLDKICGRFPDVTAKRSGDRWTVTVRIGLDIIEAVYGDDSFAEGDVIYGNFYKCGDDTDAPHYGSFASVGTKKPDFHRPEFFAPMVLTKI